MVISEKEEVVVSASDSSVRRSGRIDGVSGGLYQVRLTDSEEPLTVFCRAKGSFRHSGMTPLVGDRVIVRCAQGFPSSEQTTAEGGAVIEEILQRKNALIRPPISNLHGLFVCMAVAAPAPVLPTIDKLIAIAEYNEIEPYIVIEKCELNRASAEALQRIYVTGGFHVFMVSCKENEGVDALRSFLFENLPGKTAAFAGASGVGKSTLMNQLFPSLALETGGISRKIERGRHTTRSVRLYENHSDLSPSDAPIILADTPGFSMLDFERFDFFDKEALPDTFREFRPYLGRCRYTKCTHTKEEGCAILSAVADGHIAKSRHDSFLELYNTLKNKKEWDK